MNIFRIGWMLIACVILAAACVVTLVLLIPIDFHANLEGRIEPDHMLKVSFPLDGVLVFLTEGKTFKKGDVLARTASGQDEKRLALLTVTRGLLATELEDRECQNKLLTGNFEIESERLHRQMAMQQDQLSRVTSFSDNLNAQRKAYEDFKKEEADIIEYLFKKQIVAKLEFLKVMHDKKMAELMSEQVRSQTEQTLFTHRLEIYRLEMENKLKELAKEHIGSLLWGEALLSQIKQKILQVDMEKDALDDKVKNKKFLAPFDGQVLQISKRNGEFVKAGEVFMEIAEDAAMVFTGKLGPDARRDIKVGQKAEIYLDNYIYPKYSPVDGVLADIQTALAENGTSYVVKISIDKAPYRIDHGYAGMAKIKTFHGTVLRYLLKE